MIQAERALHAEIAVRLRMAPLRAVWISPPNGVWIPCRSEAERSLVARLIARMKADGQLTPGAPDFVFLGTDRCLCIELKREAACTLIGKHPAGRQSDTQGAFEAECRRNGVPYRICRSWPEVRDALIKHGLLPRDYTDPEQRIGRAA